jgi:hypothetical protein
MKRFLVLIILLNTTALFGQTKKFIGIWTKVNTTYSFEFDLTLKIKEGNKVEGYFLWKVVEYDRNNLFSEYHYQNRIGKTAKEYVKGTYEPSADKYLLKGYKKDDPHSIIGIDTYEITEDKKGRIGGTTNANGTWLGRINGRQVEIHFL